MKRLFFVLFVLAGVKLFANPIIKYNEAMDWMSKNENDVVRAGGIFTNEIDLDLRILGKGIQKMRLFLIETQQGHFRFFLINNVVDRIEYWNDIVYASKNEFNREVERLLNLVQSLNGNMIRNSNTMTDNYKTFKTTIRNTFEVDIDIDTYNANNGLGVFDSPLRFGTYRIKIQRIL